MAWRPQPAWGQWPEQPGEGHAGPAFRGGGVGLPSGLSRGLSGGPRPVSPQARKHTSSQHRGPPCTNGRNHGLCEENQEGPGAEQGSGLLAS